MPKFKIKIYLNDVTGNKTEQMFLILAKVSRAMKRAGLYERHWKIFHLEATGGEGLGHLYDVIEKWFYIVEVQGR